MLDVGNYVCVGLRPWNSNPQNLIFYTNNTTNNNNNTH